MSEYTPNLNLFKYNPSTDGKEVFSINQALNYNWDILDNLGSGRNIGEIVASTIPLTDAGLHLLDGSLIQGDGIYSDFVDYIANLYTDNPDANYFTDETTWQNSISQYGVCGKFVYDSLAHTVRLPKVTGIIEGTTDLTALGDLVEAGLPNITGALWGGRNTSSAYTEAFHMTGSSSSKTSRADWGENLNSAVNFNASRSSSIYGNSTTVQPQTIKVLYYIVIATSTKTDIQVDIDEIATDLNGKADVDLTNVPSSKGILTESYVNGTSWYRVYSDGWCEQGGTNTLTANSGQTIAFLKPFITTTYTIIGVQHGGDKTSNLCVTQKSTQNVTLNPNGAGDYDWQANGYIS